MECLRKDKLLLDEGGGLTMKKLLEAVNLYKTYSSGQIQTRALRDINYSFYDNQFYAIAGKSGSGKSTLLHLLGGMDNPTEGQVLYHSKNISNLDDTELSRIKRKKFGFVFQAYNLLPELCVMENILLPANLDKQNPDKIYVKEIIKTLGIQDKIHNYPSQLSGGEQQRAAIARALINKPEIIFADEPTGNLDQKNGKKVIELLLFLQKKFQQTIILVTHDKEVSRYADEILYIRDGKLIQR